MARMRRKQNAAGRQGTWAGRACGSPLLDIPNRDVLTWPSCPKIHSSTSQVPTDSKTHYPSGKLHSSKSEQATNLHSNTMSFTDKRLNTVWVRLYEVQTLAKVRGVVAFGGVVAGRRPKGSQGQVVLCVWIWVQVIKTCSICANSPKHTLRICVFFWSVVANLQTQTMVWDGGLAESLWFFWWTPASFNGDSPQTVRMPGDAKPVPAHKHSQ